MLAVRRSDRVIGLFQGKSAKQISDLAHDMSPGWNLVDMDEDIPLENAADF